MLSKRRELYQGKLDVLIEERRKLELKIVETSNSLKLIEKIQDITIGARVKFYTGGNCTQSGLVLGIDRERERIRVFVGEGIDSKAITIKPEHILEVSPDVTAGGVATSSSGPSSGAEVEASSSRGSNSTSELSSIQSD